MVVSRQRNRSFFRPLADFSFFLWRIPIFNGEFYLQPRTEFHSRLRKLFPVAAFFVGRGAGRVAGKTGLGPDFHRCSPSAKSSAENSRCPAVCAPLSAKCQGLR
jgi:hypothetical protein